MRRVDISVVGQIKDPAAREAIREIVLASAEFDLLDIASAFDIDGPFTETRTLNVTSPSIENLVEVFATFIADCKRGGQNRST